MTNTRTVVNNFPLRIFHPVHEHSSEDLLAFKHALALAYLAAGELEIIDIRDSEKPDGAFSVRGVFEKWDILPPNSERDDVEKLGLKVTKIIKKGGAKRFVGHRLEKHPHDILVIGTYRGRQGLGALFGQDLADYLAGTFRQTTLYVPDGARPFVNLDTGELSLQKVLIPVARDPAADLSFHFLRVLLNVLRRESIEVIGLHCGGTFPTPSPDMIAGLSWKEVLSTEPVVTAITQAARSAGTDLVIMTTRGRDTLSRKIMGSITEHVLHASPCPVLSIPAL